ncbi:MAG: hypothetical protein P1V51_20815 [Deltaproteobacteria bacterium]|nr:hypothetical protein [Deltaproteobacteria bacterium]
MSHARNLAASLLVLLGLTGCDASALQVADEAQANRALTVLYAAGLEPTKESSREGFDIRVSASKLREAVTALDRAGLPRRRPEGWDDTLEGGGLVPSRVEEQVRLVRGAAGEVTRTLLTLPGVIDARVHLAATGLGGGGREREPTIEKASILLRVLPDASPTEADTRAVRSLVAGAVAGLEPEHVEVVVVTLPSGRPGPDA